MGDLLKISGAGILIALLFCISPMIFLWAINTLASTGGASFYIEHTLFNYFVTLMLIAIVRGGSSSK